jgi:NitT/TauT family transport system permease protein
VKPSLVTILFFVALILIWEALFRSGIWSPILLPSPVSVAEYLWSASLDGTLLEASWVTLRRLFLGFLVGILLGLPLGLLVARSKLAHPTIGVLALGLQTLPSVCWVPLALVWFGQSELAMFFIVVMGTLWSVVVATESGVRSLPPIYVRAARTMGSRGLHTWTHVILPASLPFVLGGMKQGWAFAWRSLMAAEIYVTLITGFGLGSLLHYGRELLAMEQVVGVMLSIIAFGLAADKLIFSPGERFVHNRWGTNKS